MCVEIDHMIETSVIITVSTEQYGSAIGICCTESIVFKQYTGYNACHWYI